MANRYHLPRGTPVIATRLLDATEPHGGILPGAVGVVFEPGDATVGPEVYFIEYGAVTVYPGDVEVLKNHIRSGNHV